MAAEMNDMSRSARQNTVQSLVRGLEVLMTVIDSPDPLPLAAVTKRTGTNRATAYRMLTTLVEANYLAVAPDQPVYSPGPRTLRYLRGSQMENALRNRLQPLLTQLGEQSKETVSLLMVTWPDFVCIGVCLSPHPVRRHRSIGDVTDMTNRATGRAYMAFAPDEVDSLLAARPLLPLASGGEYTYADTLELLADVRRHGYAVSESETAMGMNGICAPVFRPGEDRPAAVISVSGPDTRWTADAMQAFGADLLAGIADAGFGPTDSVMAAIEKETK